MDLREWLAQPGNTQSKLATAVGVSQGAVSQWLRKGVSVERAISIELATGGEIKRHELRPDIFNEEAA